MKPSQQIVAAEQAEVIVKLRNLNVFINSDPFETLDEEEQGLLIKQHNILAQYSEVLGRQLALSAKKQP